MNLSLRRTCLSLIFLATCCVLPVIVNGQTNKWAWARVCDNSANVEGYLVATDAGGNVYAGLYNQNHTAVLNFGSVTVTTLNAYYNAVVVKYDPAGNAIWGLPLQGNGSLIGIATGGASSSDVSGDLYLFGSFSDSITIGTTTLHTTIGEYYLAQVSSSGAVNWAIKDGGNSAAGFSPISYYGLSGGIGLDSAGGVYVSTYFSGKSIHEGPNVLYNADTSGGSFDIMIAKYTKNGVIQWAKRAGGVKNDFVRSFAVSPSGGCHITGTFLSPSIGFGTTTITGPVGSNPSMFIAKYDNAGIPLWAESSGAFQAQPTGIATDPAGNVFVTGAFGDTVVVGGSTIVNPTHGVGNFFLTKLDSNKHFLWNKSATFPTGVTVNPAGVATLAVTTDHCGNVWIDGPMGHTGAPVYAFLLDGHRIDSAPLTNHFPLHPQDPGFVAGFSSAGSFISGKALQSGFDDMTTLACGPSGSLYLASDFVGGYLIAGIDTFLDTSYVEHFLLARYSYDSVSCLAFSGVKDLPAANEYMLYPNPATSTVRITAPGPEIRVAIFDAPGRMVLKQDFQAPECEVNIAGLQPGIYFVRINETTIRKLVKE